MLSGSTHGHLLVFAGVLLLPLFADASTMDFTETPTDLIFLNTKTARVKCKADGRPKPTISWIYANGGAVGNISGIRHVIADGSLEFPAFSAKDFNAEAHKARYKCVATNDIGILHSSAFSVKAAVDSRYSPEVFHETSHVGGHAVFKCLLANAVADHVSLVSWSLKWQSTNTEKIIVKGNSDGRFNVLKGLNHLVVSGIERGDNDLRVRCRTKDSLNGIVLTSADAYLFVQDTAPRGINFILKPTSQSVKNGSSVVLPCIANGKDLLTYSWFKDGTRITKSSRYKLVVGGTLLIKKVAEKDAGHYKCVITSGNLTQAKSMKLNVTASIKFKVKPKSGSISLISSIHFSCEVTGLPPPSINWLKNGRSLSANSRMAIDHSVMSSDLRLSKVSHRDEGIYQCVAKNSFEEKQTSARLVVGAIEPILIHKPKRRQVLEQDQSVTLKCIATGQPKPKLTWWSDGKEIPANRPRFTIVTSETASGGIQNEATIRGLRMSDSATYACKAENKAGFVETLSDLAVNGAPMIIDFPEQVYAIINKPVQLHCNAKGYPLATFTWSKDSWQNLVSDDQYKIFENGTLMINSVQKKNKGEYRCQARNSVGLDQKTLVLKVQVPPTIAPFKWTPIEAGHRTSKTCEVPTGDLPITITWFLNGRVLTNGNGVSVETKEFLSYLTFTEVKAAHRGRYTCRAENKAGSLSYSEELIVYEPPRLTVAPSDIPVLKPRTLYLKCKATGFPTPQIVWYKKAEDSVPRKLIKLSQRIRQYRNGSLLIHDTTAKDNGKYTCSAENGIGKNAEKTVTVDIKVPATVTRISAKVIKQRKGASIAMHCMATGTPELQLNWWYKLSVSRKLTNSDKHEIGKITRKTGNKAQLNSTLKINTLQRSDNGTYLCQATNSFGGDSEDIHLVVLEKPDPPKKPLPSILSSRWIEIQWVRPFDGNSRIARYAIEYKRHSDVWTRKLTLFVNGNRTKATISQLSPGVSYHFRIKASNEIGESEVSDEAILRTEEEVPSSPPLNVTVIPISRDKLKVEWRAPPASKRNGLLLGYHVNYKIFYGESKPQPPRNVRGPLSFEVFLENLMPFTQYTVTVEAYTKAGSGPASQPIIKSTLEGAPTAPPQHIKATPISSQIIRVRWDLPPLHHRNGLIKGYRVKYTEVSETKLSSEKEIIGFHYAELTNLKKYALYRISVLAFTNGGDGKLSDSYLARTLEDVPGPPQQLRAAAASPHQILVTWKKPSQPNGIITGYILHYRKSMDRSTSQHEFRLSENVSSHTLHGLEVGKEYEIWINAQTRIGTGLRSGYVKTKTMTKIPARILTLTQIVKAPVHADVRLPCIAVGHPKPSISWHFKQKRIIKRRRRNAPYYNEGKLVLSTVKMKDAGAYNCSAVNAYGSDWNIITLVVQGIPFPPVAIQVKRFNTTAVNVSWVPGFDSNSAILRHHIRYKFSNKTSWKHFSVGPKLHWMMFEMKSGSKAKFSIACENSLGVGNYSDTIEVSVSDKGINTRVIHNKRKPVLKFAAIAKAEKENVIGPIIAGCVVAVVIVTIIMLLASWDRTERRMRRPRFNRLFICECEEDFPKDQFRGTYDGPYNEPNMPWPWNSTGVLTVSDEPSRNLSSGEEERFPEQLFAQLLNFDESEEDNEKNGDVQGSTLGTLGTLGTLDSNVQLGTPSTNTYKTTSESSPLSKGLFDSLLSSRNMPSSTDSEHANGERTNAEGAQIFISRSAEDAVSQGKYTERAKRSYKDQQLRHYFKSLDSGLQNKPNLRLYLTHNGATRKKTGDTITRELPPKSIKSLTLLVRDSKVKRSKSVRSYESVSSTCSSTRGELVRAYEFGRKYKLQEYYVPQLGDSTTEDSCSEISELCEFSSLPRNTNDCLLRMPIPVRPTVVEATFKGVKVKAIDDGFDGESLV